MQPSQPTQQEKKLQRTALALTYWIGSPTSIVIHTILFVASFSAPVLGFIEWNNMLLVLTTIVSLEAIYLSLFIQMTVNFTTDAVEDISEDVEEIQEDVDEIQKDVDEIQGDVDELQEDVEDISEDVEEMSEDEKEDAAKEEVEQKTLATIQADLHKLMNDIEKLQQSHTPPAPQS